MPRWPGGLIRKTPVTPAGPYQDGAAPGVWTLAEAAYWTKQGLWPIAGNEAPIGLFGGGSTDGGSSGTSTIDKIVIATTGNATNFGNFLFPGLAKIYISGFMWGRKFFCTCKKICPSKV